MIQIVSHRWNKNTSPLVVTLGLVFFFLSMSLAHAQTEPAAPAEEDALEKEEEGVLLRDLAHIQGVRTNQLLGYGLVVGLAGTGDTRSKFASTAIQNLLGGLGQKLETSRLSQTRNIAAVLVTTEVSSFAKPGSRLSATVSSVGDARSLEGGILVQTPLYAGNKQIYAVAQGAVTTGGRASRRGGSLSRGKTVGTLLNGVVIEREAGENILGASAKNNRRLRVSLKHFDFSMLHSVREKLEDSFPNAKVELDGGSILVTIPPETGPVAFIAEMEKIRFQPRYPARVVINERSGTIIMGGDVRVDPVAISRSGVEVIVAGQQRDALLGIELGQSGRQTKRQKERPITREFSGASIREIIETLNTMGASVQDIIAILEALKDSGALHAELIVN